MCCATDAVCLFFNRLLFITQNAYKDGVPWTANKKLRLRVHNNLNLKRYHSKYIESYYETEKKRQIGRNKSSF
jgi:hypothetical protein